MPGSSAAEGANFACPDTSAKWLSPRKVNPAPRKRSYAATDFLLGIMGKKRGDRRDAGENEQRPTPKLHELNCIPFCLLHEPIPVMSKRVREPLVASACLSPQRNRCYPERRRHRLSLRPKRAQFSFSPRLAAALGDDKRHPHRPLAGQIFLRWRPWPMFQPSFKL